MKNILVPIDFSIYSLSAAKSAAVLANKTGATIHLLHIADIPVRWDKQPVAVQQEYPQLEERLVAANMKMEKFSRHTAFKNCQVVRHIDGGAPFEQINIFAKRNKVDLIVMGVHGIGESELKFIGSTAQRVVRSASCPVFGVRRNFNLGSIKKILFASDFIEDISIPISIVKDLASEFGANIDLAYINTPGNFADDETMESRMKKFMIPQKKVKFHTVIHNSTEKETGIIQCAKKRNANMIAMVTHVRKQKPSYLFGITESVLFHSPLPVLSFVIND